MKVIAILILIIWVFIYLIQIVSVVKELFDDYSGVTKKEIKQWLNPFGLFIYLRKRYNELKDE